MREGPNRGDGGGGVSGGKTAVHGGDGEQVWVGLRGGVRGGGV